MSVTAEGKIQAQAAATAQGRRTRVRNPVPREGDGGLYSQSWFAVCTSAELAAGAVLGKDFLGGRVVVYRGADGVARVKSAYCLHLGADLSKGSVEGNDLRCPFHHWAYGVDGRCKRTGVGDPAPPGARLFSFPTREKYGVVFAFNGIEPLFELADLDIPSGRTIVKVSSMPMRAEPWTFCANVPDFQHFIGVHRTLRDDIGHYDRIKWHEYGLGFQFTAFPELGRAPPIEFKVAVQGTALILVQSRLPDGRWVGTLAAMTLPRTGETEVLIVICIERNDQARDEPAEQMLLEQLMIRFRQMAAE
ncbi:MAG TPA: Rieske (2Fe-2S) protein, partial [Steroidobacteraceae bacterium]|nr:Rieske (2Fe-2S) protein [Steroidobacteraceae bacterium]